MHLVIGPMLDILHDEEVYRFFVPDEFCILSHPAGCAATLSHEELLEYFRVVQSSYQDRVKTQQCTMVRLKRQCRQLLERKNTEVCNFVLLASTSSSAPHDTVLSGSLPKLRMLEFFIVMMAHSQHNIVVIVIGLSW